MTVIASPFVSKDCPKCGQPATTKNYKTGPAVNTAGLGEKPRWEPGPGTFEFFCVACGWHEDAKEP